MGLNSLSISFLSGPQACTLKISILWGLLALPSLSSPMCSGPLYVPELVHGWVYSRGRYYCIGFPCPQLVTVGMSYCGVWPMWKWSVARTRRRYLVHLDIPYINFFLLPLISDLSNIHRSIDNIPWTLLCLFLITYLLNESSPA